MQYNPQHPQPTPVPSKRPERPKRTGALIATIITGIFAWFITFGVIASYKDPEPEYDLVTDLIGWFVVCLPFAVSLWLLVRPVPTPTPPPYRSTNTVSDPQQPQAVYYTDGMPMSTPTQAQKHSGSSLKIAGKVLSYIAMICFSVCGLIFCSPVYYALFTPGVYAHPVWYIIIVSLIALFFLYTLVKVFINIAKDIIRALSGKSAEQAA